MVTMSKNERHLRFKRRVSLIVAIEQFNREEDYSVFTYTELLNAMETEINIELNRIKSNAE